jgi:hypothetical protein
MNGRTIKFVGLIELSDYRTVGLSIGPLENMKINCELDFLISSKEISDGISKLKRGKG